MTNADPPAHTTRPWAPIAGMVALVHAAFLLGAVLRNSDATSPTLFTIRSGADAFYFGWLFAIPLLLELLVVGWPLTRLVSRLTQRPTRPGAVLAVLGLFALYFLLDMSLYGPETAACKTGLLGVFFGLLLGWGYFSGETDEE